MIVFYLHLNTCNWKFSSHLISCIQWLIIMSSGIFEFQLGHCIWSQLTSIIPVLIILQQNWGFQPAFPDPMSDPKHRPPTAAEVVGRLKDDGDFDALRRAIVRKVKDNVSFPQTSNPPNPLPQGFAISLFVVPNPARGGTLMRICHSFSLNSLVDCSSLLLD